jgi:hypothetical protein
MGFQPRQIGAERNLNAAERRIRTEEDKRQFTLLKTWRFPFDLDRVFWFASLENRVVEIRRPQSAEGIPVKSK